MQEESRFVKCLSAGAAPSTALNGGFKKTGVEGADFRRPKKVVHDVINRVNPEGILSQGLASPTKRGRA